MLEVSAVINPATGLRLAGQRRGTPSVYLDHCAFRKISEVPARAKAFRDALFARDGSLAMSVLNLVEFWEVTDARQLAAAEQFIESLLPRIYMQSTCYPQVMDAERKKRSAAGYPGNPDADLRMLDFITTVARHGGPLTVRGLFNPNTTNTVPNPATMDLMQRQVIQHIETNYFKTIGDARKRDVLGTIQRSLLTSPTESLLIAAVEYMYGRRGTPLKPNDVMDLAHAIVPTMYCHYVILDKNTAQTMNVAKRRVREACLDYPFARVYSMAKDGLDQLIADIATDPADAWQKRVA
jgi:hypothetical protein